MKRLEVIRVRLFRISNAARIGALLHQFQTDTVEMMAKHSVCVRLLRNAEIENDWSVHLIYPFDSTISGRSALAEHLTELFRPIGLVHHDTWLPDHIDTGQAFKFRKERNQ